MLYGLDDLVTEIAYACSLRKSEVEALLPRARPAARAPHAAGEGRPLPRAGDGGRLLANSPAKGPAVGMDIDEDLRAAWFIGFAFEADPTFLRAHSLAAAPAPHELVAPAARVNYSALARSCGLDRDQVATVTAVFANGWASRAASTRCAWSWGTWGASARTTASVASTLGLGRRGRLACRRRTTPRSRGRAATRRRRADR